MKTRVLPSTFRRPGGEGRPIGGAAVAVVAAGDSVPGHADPCDDTNDNDEHFDERYFVRCDSPELLAFSDVDPDIDMGETYCSPSARRDRWEQKLERRRDEETLGHGGRRGRRKDEGGRREREE